MIAASQQHNAKKSPLAAGITYCYFKLNPGVVQTNRFA